MSQVFCKHQKMCLKKTSWKVDKERKVVNVLLTYFVAMALEFALKQILKFWAIQTLKLFFLSWNVDVFWRLYLIQNKNILRTEEMCCAHRNKLDYLANKNFSFKILRNKSIYFLMSLLKFKLMNSKVNQIRFREKEECIFGQIEMFNYSNKLLTGEACLEGFCFLYFCILIRCEKKIWKN